MWLLVWPNLTDDMGFVIAGHVIPKWGDRLPDHVTHDAGGGWWVEDDLCLGDELVCPH